MKIVSKSCLIVMCAVVFGVCPLSAKCKENCHAKQAKQQELEAAKKKAEELAASLEKEVEQVAELEAFGESEEIAESIVSEDNRSLEQAVEAEEAVR